MNRDRKPHITPQPRPHAAGGASNADREPDPEPGLKRGNLLWEGSRMFLPEHRAALQARRRRQQAFQMPVLGPDQLAKIDQAISRALDEDRPLTITYAAETEARQVHGRVVVMPQLRALLIDGRRIPFDRILDAEL